MKRLIVNADDFGLCPGVDAAITELAGRGVLSSVSVLIDLVSAESLRRLRAAAPAAGLGLHVDFTSDLLRFAPGDLAGRLARQLARFTELVGGPPDHLDTHKHVHRAHRAARAALAATGLPCRAPDRVTRRWLRARGVACPDHFAGGVGPRSALTVPRLHALVRNLEVGTTELMCHPARAWDGPARLTYTSQRVGEYHALLHGGLRERLRAHGAELVGFSALRQAPCASSS